MIWLYVSLVTVLGATVYSWIHVLSTSTKSADYEIKKIIASLFVVLTLNLLFFKGAKAYSSDNISNFVSFHIFGWAVLFLAFIFSGGTNIFSGLEKQFKIMALISLPFVLLSFVWITWQLGVSLGFFLVHQRS